MLVNTKGIVLGRKKVAESDVIMTVLTASQGKVRMYAYGARNPRSHFASASQTFVEGQFTYQQGKDLASLKNVEIDEAHMAIRENLDRLFLGAYMVELVELALEDNDHIPRLFDLVTHAIRALDHDDNLKKLQLTYTLKLIKMLGFEPQLFDCSLCGSQAHLVPSFSVQHGGVICQTCYPNVSDVVALSLEHLKWINVTLKSPNATIQSLQVNDMIVTELNALMNRFVENHVVRRPLKSLDMLGRS